jgi:hypothetical protein
MERSIDGGEKAWVAQEKQEQKERRGPMQPSLWQPPIEPSAAEQAILKRIKRAKLFVFLREHRHELFDEAFQQELAALYQPSKRGQPPIPPAQLAEASILQAYTGASDDEVIEAMTMDRRWQLVVDCVDAQEPPFSKGTLIAFRKRLIETHMDRRLIERTMELAQQTGGFGPGPLRAALDSSPLWGSSRVEDTYNLLGHALRKALGVIARKPRRGLAELATEADAPVLGGSSLKAALDRDWDDAAEREQALVVVLETLNAVEQWLDSQPEGHDDPVVHYSMAAAQQVKQQDVEFPEIGNATLRKGVAKDRPITIEDAHMRHVDRAYLSSSLVRQRSADLQVYCQAWPVRNGTHFPKTAFHLDWQQQRIRCPHAQELPFEPGGVGHFPSDICAACPLRDRCTSSPHGRSVSIHPDEQLLWELRQRPVTPQGRTKLRERVAVEHALAHIGRWQGRRARYRGVRKNLFDLRRTAVVHNLHVIARLPARLQIA